MHLIHTLASTGQDGPEAYAECTCGMRAWGDSSLDAYDAFQLHAVIAKLQQL